jgi:hypothetical protein
MQRRIFGRKRNVVKRERRKLHNTEAYYLFSSPSKCDQIEEAVEGGSCSRFRELGNASKF